MSFLKKYGVALIASLLVIVLAVLIGGDSIRRAANRDYYKRWVMDDAGLFSDDAKAGFAKMNEALDQTYGSVFGVITVQSLGGADIGEAVYVLGEDGGFGQNDLILLIAEGDRQWYLAYGDVIAQYADQTLRFLVIDSIDESIYDGAADDHLQSLCQNLPGWYEQHVPHIPENGGRRTGISGRGFLGTFARVVLLALLLFVMTRYLFYPLLNYHREGRWTPLWGWRLFPRISAPSRKISAEKNERRGKPDGENAAQSHLS